MFDKKLLFKFFFTDVVSIRINAQKKEPFTDNLNRFLFNFLALLENIKKHLVLIFVLKDTAQ